MYSLSDSLQNIPGIGEVTAKLLADSEIKTVLDFLLFVPLNYEDLSKIVTIDQLEVNQTQTVKAKVIAVNERYKYTGKKKLTITTAIIEDETGRCKSVWFNNRFIKRNLVAGKEFFFAGKFSDYHNFSQPTVEVVSDNTTHTGRLVPRYSQTTHLKQGNIRRWLKTIIENLEPITDPIANDHNLLNLTDSLKQLHFPEKEELVIKARERLAIEELLILIQHSKTLKQNWGNKIALASPAPISKFLSNVKTAIPKNIPFELTNDQLQALKEILKDLTKSHPMNRLLVGDVGTGKTVVAGIAAYHIIKNKHHSVLIAPTQILAEQHQQTFNKLFPDLPTQLLTANTKLKLELATIKKPSLFIGTHSVINQLKTIKPALVIYDEQHRFGVEQRATAILPKSEKQPHLLTMSATPIPRSYMLTIFSHLDLSLITQSPFGSKQVKSWFVPKNKKDDAYDWLQKQISDSNSPKKLAMIVCPFIEPSKQEGFEDIPAAKQLFSDFKDKWGNKYKITLLHGQQKPIKQEQIIKQLFANKIDILISTSIVEVGVDLPQANIMIIEGADRFGLASLHQLRGRVGRQGQEAYCLLFSSSSSSASSKRLSMFSKENDGLKLAELDLKNRGPGNLFGYDQHGFSELRFASWNNAQLIKTAQKIFKSIEKNKNWTPVDLKQTQKKYSEIVETRVATN